MELRVMTLPRTPEYYIFQVGLDLRQDLLCLTTELIETNIHFVLNSSSNQCLRHNVLMILFRPVDAVTEMT